MAAERQHLEQPGVDPHPSQKETPAKARTSGSGAYERGPAALISTRTAPASATIPRPHTETLPDGTSVRLWMLVSNTKSRRKSWGRW
jgi:hypothetical protein